MAKRPTSSKAIPDPLVEPREGNATTIRTAIIAFLLLLAAFAMFVFRDSLDQNLVVLLLAILAVIGMFFLFGSVTGLVTFGSGKPPVHPGIEYLNALHEGVCITDDTNAVVYANHAYGKTTGAKSAADVKSPEQLFAGHDDVANAIYRLMTSVSAGKTAKEELRTTTGLGVSHGEPMWYRVGGWPMYSTNIGKNLKVWSLEDITRERQDQERVFRELQQAIDHLDEVPVGFFAADQSGRVQYINSTLAGWFGMDLVSVSSKSITIEDLLGIDNAASLGAELHRDNGSGPIIVDTEIGDGELNKPVRLIHVPASEMTNGTVLPSRTVVIDDSTSATSLTGRGGGDIRFNRFFDSTPMAIATLNKQGVVVRTNNSFSRMFAAVASAEHLAGRAVFESLLHETDVARFRKAFADAAQKRDRIEPFEARLPISVKNDLTNDEVFVRVFINGIAKGGVVEMEGHAEPSEEEAVLVYVMDTTEQKGLENQMAQSQKMQAVGQLAGGIAHDFNNVLTAIIMSSDLLLTNHRPSDPSFPDIMNIKQNANRAASLVRQLLAFSRRQTLRPQVLSVTDVLADLRMLLTRLVGNEIDVHIEHGRELWPVKADLGQFEQVVVNLCVNARDAMPDGGTLTIRTSNVLSADVATLNYRGLQKEHDYVLIDIEDQGTGIEPDVLQKIFEPFFSTKEVGKGTGLGLSMVYGIIKQTGGHIYADSEVGKGSTFRIFLPRHVVENVEQIAAIETVPAKADEEKRRDLSGSATVLLVEDEPAVRMGGVRALQSRGYTVHEAGSGVEAMEVMEDHGDEVDLIVSDVVMPEMDGPSLLREVRKLRPDIKFVFVSGYAEEAFSKNLPEGEKFGFLPKPFSLKQLATKVKETLNEVEAD
ncbi:MAG: ATP-binding protein [Pseudomonadota bacterium]